jgi:hypothetical protein
MAFLKAGRKKVAEEFLSSNSGASRRSWADPFVSRSALENP